MPKMFAVSLTGAITEAASAAKVAIAAPGAPDVFLGFPSEKILWVILFGNAVGVIVYLWKTLRDTEKEDIKEIKQNLRELSAHIKTLPTRETVEMMMWKHMKDRPE